MRHVCMSKDTWANKHTDTYIQSGYDTDEASEKQLLSHTDVSSHGYLNVVNLVVIKLSFN